MGLVTMGVPEEITLALAKLGGIRAFVETGTFKGGTTVWASEHFDRVDTIERAEPIYAEHNERLREIEGVTPHLGDSRSVLPGILESLGDSSAVFWLDGHWSGGGTAGEEDECPIMEELELLGQRTGDIVLIDDARLYLCAPPKPHNPADWPTLVEIIKHVLDWPEVPIVQVVDDVIFIVPQSDEIKSALIEYSQVRANDFWKTFSKHAAVKPTSGGSWNPFAK